MAQLYPFTDPIEAERSAPMRVVAGRGCHVTDEGGVTYLDAVAGLWCASLGFADERLRTAAVRQMETLSYYHSFMGRTAEVTERLAGRLVSHLPAPLSHVFFGCTGSDAVDSAVKVARFYQNARGKSAKKRIVAREGGYHGSGIASASLTSMSYCHDGFDLADEKGVLRTGRPHHFRDALPGEDEQAFSARRADELDALIRAAGPETVAAFIAEPVIGSGGAIPPPEGYWAAISAVLRRHDVLLIADEIITGFGRTGEWFGSDTYAIEPDLMTMAKQLSGAHFPISALGVSGQVHEVIAAHAHELGTFGHGYTYGGHPVGAAIALEAIRIYEDMDLPRHVGALGTHLAGALAPLAGRDGVDQVRQVGLIAGVELDGRFVERGGERAGQPGAFGRAVGEEARRRGVLFRVIGDTLAISPPLIVTSAEIDRIVATLAESIAAVAGHRAA